MTPADERDLYESDHAAWCRYMAPRWHAMFKDADPETKRDAWAKASPALRDELTRLAKQEAT